MKFTAVVEKEILAFTLENAIKYNGKATIGGVLGKILGRHPDLREHAEDLKKHIVSVISEVNLLSPEEQFQKFNAIDITIEKQTKEKVEGLKELPDSEGRKIVMRFEPSPSGPLHIGHSYVLGLNYEYTKKYGGDLILRIGDTNPDNICEDSYQYIPQDAQWLCENNIKQIYIQSERMELYYDYALRMINENHIYICDCDGEEFKKYIQEQVNCPCRKLSPSEHLKRWHKMFDAEHGYQQGEAVARFKGDMKDPNPAMRDFPLLRINETDHVHVGRKYRVWPLMNFSVSVDDADMGITHTLRGKDHADNAKRQALIHATLGVTTPTAISVGRINFEGGAPVSCSKTRPLIENGEYSGWDDVRLPFLLALRRRGYKPEALRKYAVEVGISKNDKSVTMEEFFKTIDHHNRQILDAVTHRYFFVDDPVLVKIEGAPEQMVELDLHPDNRKGGREFVVNDQFYITKQDYDEILSYPDGTLIRLMDCLNFSRQGKKFVFHSAEYAKYKEHGKKIIHWLPGDDTQPVVAVMMPNGHKREGIGEKTLLKLQEGEHAQLERFGFARLDKKGKDSLMFYFTHL